MQVEAAAAHAAFIGDVAHLQDHLARIVGRVLLLVEARDVAADHHLHEAFRRQVRALQRADIAAIAQHRHAVRQLIDFRHPVADVDDREAFLAQLADQVEEAVGFARRERRGRLVHHEDAGPGMHGPRDLDQLLFGDRQVAHQRMRLERRAEALQHFLAAAFHRGAVDEAHRAAQLAPGVDVLGHRQVRREAQFLVDHRDAERLGRERSVDHDGLALDQDLPAGIGLIGA
ncbi:hypothetical protein AWB68_08874 [Caballeronia choica]|uniref:Uncharacterized protein n=1 Tax=Caballeronia choica TaxID=326476 RepID=A0A158L5V2_9BURK|nr:hypothetical protein AWB68_08874 [Caballeronia choica]